MPQIGTPENPLRVAVVGAGPSGFYAAEHILKDGDVHAQVDLFDRLPTPFGLVRGGVAPDHPKIKSVIRVYEKTAAREGFRFFGNVKIGHDVEVSELEDLYHAIVFTVGCETDRRTRDHRQPFASERHTADEGIDGQELPCLQRLTEPQQADPNQGVAAIFVGNQRRGIEEIAHRYFDIQQYDQQYQKHSGKA